MIKKVDEISLLKRGVPKVLNEIVYVEKRSGMPSKFKVPKLNIKLWSSHGIK